MSFGDNIKDIRINRNISRKLFASQIGISEQMLSGIESNKRGNLPDWFYKLGDVLNCSYDMLIKGTTEKQEISMVSIEEINPSNERLTEVFVSKTFLDSLNLESYDDILYLKYECNNMYPEIQKGDDVYLNTKQREIINNKLYAIKEDSKIRIKRLYRTSPYDTVVHFYDDNELNGYADYEIQQDKAKELIIGRVVYFGRKEDE
jgi:transcriptional regulator with XRE-family HTH domain